MNWDTFLAVEAALRGMGRVFYPKILAAVVAKIQEDIDCRLDARENIAKLNHLVGKACCCSTCETRSSIQCSGLVACVACH